MTKTLYTECVDLIKQMVDHEYLYFDTSVEVKLSPHHLPFSAWAVCVSPENEMHVMDSDECWHILTEADNNGALVISSLYQRLKLMRIHYAKA